MTSDFRTGKAYRIKGKDVEQVKSEIKEWFTKNGFEFEEDGDFILAYVYPIEVGYSHENKIKIQKCEKDTLIIFHKKSTVAFPHDKRKNLVRSISDKKEFTIDSNHILGMGAAICVLALFMVVFVSNHYYAYDYNRFVIDIVRFVFIIIIFIYMLRSRRLSSLPNSKYYVEECNDVKKSYEIGESYSMEISTCPNCNKEIDDSWDICLHCGIKLKSKKNVRLIFNNPRFYIAIVGVIVISLIVVASTIFAPNAEKYVAEGVSLYNQGKYDASLEKFEKAINIDPNNVHAWNGKGLALYKKGKLSDAVYCFDKTLSIDPNYAVAWFCKGLVLEDLGENAKAQECFDKARELGYIG